MKDQSARHPCLSLRSLRFCGELSCLSPRCVRVSAVDAFPESREWGRRAGPRGRASAARGRAGAARVRWSAARVRWSVARVRWGVATMACMVLGGKDLRWVRAGVGGFGASLGGW